MFLVFINDLPCYVKSRVRLFADDTRDFKIQRRDRKENVRKTIDLISKTTTLHVHHTFFVHFSPFFARLRRENVLFRSLFKEDVNKQRRNFISLSELISRSLEVQHQEGLPTCDKVSG